MNQKLCSCCNQDLLFEYISIEKTLKELTPSIVYLGPTINICSKCYGGKETIDKLDKADAHCFSDYLIYHVKSLSGGGRISEVIHLNNEKLQDIIGPWQGLIKL